MKTSSGTLATAPEASVPAKVVLNASFVTDAGLRPIDVGPLRRARELEGFQFVIMTLQANPAFDTFNWNTSLNVLV